MKEVALYEAKTRLSELLGEVERGEEFTITRRGRAVARLVSATPARAASQATQQRKQVREVFEALTAARPGVTLDIPLADAIGTGRD